MALILHTASRWETNRQTYSNLCFKFNDNPAGPVRGWKQLLKFKQNLEIYNKNCQFPTVSFYCRPAFSFLHCFMTRFDKCASLRSSTTASVKSSTFKRLVHCDLNNSLHGIAALITSSCRHTTITCAHPSTFSALLFVCPSRSIICKPSERASNVPLSFS